MNVPTASYKRGEWLNPLNRMVWQAAFKAKREEVTLTLKMPTGNGDKKTKITFSIEYRSNGKIWVQPKNEGIFVPCGWFDYKTATELLWLTEGGGKSDGSDASTQDS